MCARFVHDNKDINAIEDNSRVGMTTPQPPTVSFVLATYNRCATALETLSRIGQCGLDRSQYETIVVDNASTDGTRERLAPACDRLIRQRRNLGSCAKAIGVPHARGEYIVFLDDDSAPRPGSILRMIEKFEANARLGAAGFRVFLPDGSEEGSALPGVFVGCGVGFRAEALRECGGLDLSYFMQAEEYDLAFRMATTGWHLRVFDDLYVEHLKSPHARCSERTMYFDARNNLRIARRFLPTPWQAIYHEDWKQRYKWLAQSHGLQRSFRRGVRADHRLALWDKILNRRSYLSGDTLERFFQWKFLRQRMRSLAMSGARRVLFADLGKNIAAYYHAAQAESIEVVAVADDCFHAAGRFYRGVPVVQLAHALAYEFDAVVVSNSSLVHGRQTLARVTVSSKKPTYHWIDPNHQQQILSRRDVERMNRPHLTFDEDAWERGPAAAKLERI